MVLNGLTGALSWHDAGGDNPGWEGEEELGRLRNEPGKTRAHQFGLDMTGQAQGFVLDYTPFPDGLYPALATEAGGREVELKDGDDGACAYRMGAL